MIEIPRTLDVQNVAQPRAEEARKVRDLVEATKIQSHGDLRRVTSWTGMIKSQFREVDEKRKSFVNPLKEVIDDINRFFSPALQALEDAEVLAKTGISQYVHACCGAREAALQDAANASEEEAKALAISKAELLEPPKLSGLSIRESWQGDLEDETKAKKWALETGRVDLLCVDVAALKAITKAKGDPGVPGWRVTKQRTVVITPSKVDPL